MKIFISFLFLLTFAILVGIYVSISSINEDKIVIKREKEIKIKKEELKKPIVYNIPARILFMKISLKKFRYILIYKLILNVKDRFSLFNLKTFLENLNLVYSMRVDRKNANIYLLFRSLNEAERVLNLLKEYNFNVKIQKIKQRI